MTTVLIIAHAPLASALKAVAQHTYPDCAAQVQSLDVQRDASAEQVEAAARALIAGQRDGDTLILVDVFGATPCRGAVSLLGNPRVRLVAGVNVPMLWRTLCYGVQEPLDALVARAVAGASQGVMAVSASPQRNQVFRPTAHDQEGCFDQ
jgi:PTS system ascorbate-specific IIA component